MGNVLVIRNADFSGNKVETIALVRDVVNDENSYILKELKLQIPTTGTTFSVNVNYNGGFIKCDEYSGDPIVIKNLANTTSYYAFIKNPTFTNGGSFSYPTGESLHSLSKNNQVSLTIPSDADYIYVLVTSGGNPISSKVVITTPFE